MGEKSIIMESCVMTLRNVECATGKKNKLNPLTSELVVGCLMVQVIDVVLKLSVLWKNRKPVIQGISIQFKGITTGPQ